MSCGVGHSPGLDPALLWLWRRPAAAAPIGPLAWEPPEAAGAALKRQNNNNNNNNNNKWTYGSSFVLFPSFGKFF